MKVGSLCVIFFYVGWTLCFDYAQATGTCGLLSPPSNGAIASCTRGNRSGSRCRVRCLTGFTPMQVSRVCNCLGELCRWNGRNPTCEPLECRKPDIDDGRITIVEEWATGFASLVEFPYIPSNVSEGWAILIAFDRPLGNNAFLSSWSSQPTSVSPSHNAFTLNNLPYNSNLGSLNSHYRTLVVIQGVEGEKPQRGYVGLFNGRLTDATCHTPSRLSDLETLPAYTTTTPAPTTTVATTTTETPARLTTQPAATTPDVTTTSTAETTAAVTTTTEVPTTTPATTTTPTRTTTTTTTATTTTTTTRATTTAAPSNSVQFQGKSCRIQRIGAYRTEATGWVDNGTSFFSGKLKYNVPAAVSDWLLVIVFQQRVKHMQVWSARVAGSMRNGYVWKLSALSWNAVLYPGELQMNFIAGLWQQTNDYPSGRVYLCSSEYNTGDAVDLFPNSNHANDVEEEAEEEEEEEEEEGEEETSVRTRLRPAAVRPRPSSRPRVTTPTTTASTQAATTVNPSRCNPSSRNGVVVRNARQTRPSWKRAKDNTTYDYNEVLHKSNLFYNAQRSGALSPRYNRILWRGDSCLKDGCSIGVDLSKGWFDAGDYIKFMFPMASTVTLLSWGGINYRQAYFDSGTLSRFIGSIRWATSYLIAAHIAPQELVVQVGSGSSHRFWSRPEEITGARPIYKITPTKPGSDVAAETAAALAAASIFLRPTHAATANDALAHARTIYSFAKQHRGLYHVSVPQAKRYYKSYSDEDEMIWGAAWLYRATGEQRYLNDATNQYLRASGPYLVEREFSWDRKMIGVQVLMANLTGEAMYRDRVADFMNNVMNVIPSTPQGLMWLRKWGPNRYAANAAMMAIMASQLQPPLPNSALYERWGRRQIHLLLGDSGRSYVVGFGRNYPQRPHHRSSSCPKPPAVCNHGSGLHSRRRNPFTLFGALVGGPDKRGNYLDRRTKYEQSEVGLDYNAGFQSAVAGLKQLVVERRPPRQSTTRSG